MEVPRDLNEGETVFEFYWKEANSQYSFPSNGRFDCSTVIVLKTKSIDTIDQIYGPSGKNCWWCCMSSVT